MRNLIILLFTLLLISSCSRTAKCWDPPINIHYKCDTSDTIIFKFNTYEKGSGFSKIITSDIDTAFYRHHINFSYGIYPSSYDQIHMSIDNPSYDYIIEILETGKRYSISDIHYDGLKKVKYGSVISEDDGISCTHNIHYNMNEQQYSVEGGQYHKYGGGSYKQAVITITK